MTFVDVINVDKERKITYKESKSSFENLNDWTVYVANGLSSLNFPLTSCTIDKTQTNKKFDY